MTTLAVGVMSGTSLDGISTALVRLDDGKGGAELVAFRQEPYSSAERGAIIDAMARGTPKDVAFLHVALGERFAAAVLGLLAQARASPNDLDRKSTRLNSSHSQISYAALYFRQNTS